MNNKLASRRFKTKSQILRDNLFKPANILRLIIPLILGVVFIILISYISINISYLNKLVTIESIPAEVENSLIILGGKEFETDQEEINKILAENESLYLSRKINKLNIFILTPEQSEESLKEYVASATTKINSENIVYNFSYKNIEDVCMNVQKEGTEKGILFATGRNILRSLYLCNSFNLYYTGFKIEQSEGMRGIQLIDFNFFIRDFFKNIFHLNQNER